MSLPEGTDREPVIQALRREYHTAILRRVLGYRPKDEGTLGHVLTNADKGSASSVRLASALAAILSEDTGVKVEAKSLSGQEAGSQFAQETMKFVEKGFSALRHLRPGEWRFTTQGAITCYDQYHHLTALKKALKECSILRASIWSDYLVLPDIMVVREPVPETDINSGPEGQLVPPVNSLARYTALRQSNKQLAILHASISCKWTIRSDRAQNTRTEALNLIRHRVGKLPHIVAVTGEPLPTRIASLADGTGDLDCVYHMALPELQRAVRQERNEDQHEVLTALIHGRRLRDIGDLVFDLAT